MSKSEKKKNRKFKMFICLPVARCCKVLAHICLKWRNCADRVWVVRCIILLAPSFLQAIKRDAPRRKLSREESTQLPSEPYVTWILPSSSQVHKFLLSLIKTWHSLIQLWAERRAFIDGSVVYHSWPPWGVVHHYQSTKGRRRGSGIIAGNDMVQFGRPII